MTEHHTRRINPEPVSDPVAVAFWPTDTHSVRRIVRDGAAYNEGFVFDDNNWGPFGISYRSLIPRRTEATNLLTPTCPSSSHVAYGAIRLEQTFMSLGQAAANAAVLALTRGVAVQDVDYSTLRDQLVRGGQIVSCDGSGEGERAQVITPTRCYPEYERYKHRRVRPHVALDHR